MSCVLVMLATPLHAANAADPGSAGMVKVFQRHTTDWRIAAPPPGSPGVNWGVTELQKYLQRMALCRFPVVKTSRGKPAFVVGLRNEILPEDRALLPPSAPGYDGYAIAVRPATRKTPARIVIGGDNPRGVIYGVYDLLERCGCRWFYPAQDPADPEVVPQLDSLLLPTGSWAVACPARIFRSTKSERQIGSAEGRGAGAGILALPRQTG